MLIGFAAALKCFVGSNLKQTLIRKIHYPPYAYFNGLLGLPLHEQALVDITTLNGGSEGLKLLLFHASK